MTPPPSPPGGGRAIDGPGRLRLAGVARVARRVSWPLVDQVLWSSSNFAALVLAAGELSADAFGAVAAALLIYTLLLSANRALALEPLLLAIGRDRDHLQGGTDAGRRAEAASGLVGVGGLVVFLVVGLVTSSDELRVTCLVAAPLMPPLLHQDAWRYHHLNRDPGPRMVARCDGLWLGLMLAGLVTCMAASALSAGAVVAIWGWSGVVAYLATVAGDLRRSSFRGGRRWLGETFHLGGYYLMTFAVSTGVSYTLPMVLGWAQGVADLGAVRAAQTLYGPISIIYSAVYVILVPAGVRAAARSGRELLRLALLASAAWTAASGLLVLGMVLLPRSLGEVVLGTTWASADRLLVPVGVGYVGGSLLVGGAVGLRALGEARSIARCQVAALPVTAVAPLVAAVGWGATAMCWMIALGSLVSAGIVWGRFWSVLARRGPAAEASGSGPTVAGAGPAPG